MTKTNMAAVSPLPPTARTRSKNIQFRFSYQGEEPCNCSHLPSLKQNSAFNHTVHIMKLAILGMDAWPLGGADESCGDSGSSAAKMS